MARRTISLSGGNRPRAKVVNTFVPAATTGLLTTVSSFGLLAPVTFAPTGSWTGCSLNTATGGITASTGIASGTAKALSGTVTAADGVVMPFVEILTALGVLGPTTASFNVTSPSGSDVIVFTGLATGEVVSSISPVDNRIVLNAGGTKAVIGLTLSTAGVTNYTFTTSLGRSLTVAVTASSVTTLSFGSLNWKNVNIGGGGYQAHTSVSSDGTLASSTDVYGGYVWDSTAQRWNNTINAKSLPKSIVEINKSPGPWSFRVAYSDSNRLYSLWQGKLIRSDNRGQDWVTTAYTDVPLVDAPGNNGTWRLTGQSMAIDPVNPDVVIVSSANSIRMSSDAGASWTDLALGTQPGLPGYAIAFDPSSAVTGGKTQGIYIFKYGTGLYRSTNGGSTFAAVSAASGTPPTTYQKMFVSPAGLVFTSTTTGSSSPILNIYDPGTNGWTTTNVNPQGTSAGNRRVMSMAFDPTNPNRVVACADTAVYLSQSMDGGRTWAGWKTHAVTNVGGVNRYLNVATDIPWLAYTNDNFKSAGDIFFDPTNINRLCIGGGIGFFTTTFNGADGFTWTSQTKGMETMVANFALSVPGGPFVMGVWDRDTLTMSNLDTSPTKQGTDASTTIVACWDIDYAGSNPSFVAKMSNTSVGGFVEKSAYSTDGGRNWNYWPSYPNMTVYTVTTVVNSVTKNPGDPKAFDSAQEGGCLAVSTPLNAIIFPSATQGYRTADGGNNWTPIVMNDGTNVVTVTDYTGFINFRAFQRKIACADRVRPGVFRVYNTSTVGGNTAKGLWESVNGGQDWTKVYTGEIGGGTTFSAKLRATPGIADDMWFTAGTLSGTPTATSPGSSTIQLYHSTNGGRAWTAISASKIEGVIDFAFGAPYPGSAYSYAIYALGYVNNVYGVYRSDDIGANWIKMSDAFPQGTMDVARTLFADMNNFGTVGIGYYGSSYGYFGTPNDGNLYMVTAPVVAGSAAPSVVATRTPGTWASKSGGTLTRTWKWYTGLGTTKNGAFVLDDLGLPAIVSGSETPISGTDNATTYTLQATDTAPNVLTYIKEAVTVDGGNSNIVVNSNPIGNPLYNDDPYLTALLARLTVQPGPIRRLALNNFLAGLRADGILPLMDSLYIPSALYVSSNTDYLKSAVNSTYDLVVRAGTVNSAVANGQNTLHPAAGGYVGSGFNPTSASSPKFTLNSAHMLMWLEGIDAVTDGGYMGTTNALIARATVSSQSFGRSSNFAAVSTGGTMSNDLNGWSRIASNGYTPYVSGTSLGFANTSSAAIPNAEFELGRAGSGSTAPGIKFSFACWGAGLTDTQVATLRARVSALRTSVGSSAYNL